MSDETVYRLTPKGHLTNAVMSVFPGCSIGDATQVWDMFNDSVYRHAGKSDDPNIAEAEYLALVLDGHGGDLIPVEKDDL